MVFTYEEADTVKFTSVKDMDMFGDLIDITDLLGIKDAMLQGVFTGLIYEAWALYALLETVLKDDWLLIIEEQRLNCLISGLTILNTELYKNEINLIRYEYYKNYGINYTTVIDEAFPNMKTKPRKNVLEKIT